MPRMITDLEPTDWRDLQNQVATILRECGFTVAIEKTVATARGKVELDVHAEEKIHGRAYTLIYECKQWKQRIPQHVIHAFRSVCADLGAHKGYIVCANGFQEGAFNASELTNIELVTWQQFQEQYCQSWIENHFVPTITKRLDALMGYTEPVQLGWLLEFEDLPEVQDLMDRHQSLGTLAMSLSEYSIHMKRYGAPELPLGIDQRYTGQMNLPKQNSEARGYRELLNAMLDHGEVAITEFRNLRTRLKP